MNRKRTLTATFGFVAGIFLSANACSRRSGELHYVDLQILPLERIDQDVKDYFTQNGYDVTGDAGWNCYHVRRRADNRNFSSCVGSGFKPNASGFDDKMIELHAYTMTPE